MRIRTTVRYIPERSSGAETDSSYMDTYRLSDATCAALRELLGERLTPGLLVHLSHVVGQARWMLATDRARVTPQDMIRAASELRRGAKHCSRLLHLLNADNHAQWVLGHEITEPELSTIKASLTRLAAAATAASLKVGVCTISETENGLQESYVIGKPQGRPQESHRRGLAQATAYALATQGMRPTKARGGLFENVLRLLIRDAGLFEPADLHRDVFRAVDHARWLEPSRERLARTQAAGKKAL